MSTPSLDDLFPAEPSMPAPPMSHLDSLADIDWESHESRLGLESGVAKSIHSMLCSGIMPKEVAQAEALPESLMERVISDPAFRRLVKDSIMARHQLKDTMDSYMDDIEYKTLFKLSHSVAGMSTSEALATFKVMNAAERKQDIQRIPTSPEASLVMESIGEEEVELEVLPPTKPKVVIDNKGAIQEVNGRPLQTMSLLQLEEEVESNEQSSRHIEDQSDPATEATNLPPAE